MSYCLPEVDGLIAVPSIITKSIALSNNLSIHMNNYGILIVVIVLIMSTLIAMAGQTQIFVVLSQKRFMAEYDSQQLGLK